MMGVAWLFLGTIMSTLSAELMYVVHRILSI